MITLANGLKLDDELNMAPALAHYAKIKGLDDIRVFCVINTAGEAISYLLVVGTTPEFESQEAEAVATHIDMLHAAKMFEGK